MAFTVERREIGRGERQYAEEEEKRREKRKGERERERERERETEIERPGNLEDVARPAQQIRAFETRMPVLGAVPIELGGEVE